MENNIKHKFCNNCKNKENNDDIYITPESWEIVEKAETTENNKNVYIIKGYASLPVKDRESEIILKDGIIFDEFLKYGYFNYDHLHLPQYILGVPQKAFIDQTGFYTEGILFDTPIVRDIVELYKVSKSAGINRLLGMSIEGKVLERDPYDPSIIRKVSVRWIAISPKVINHETTKSFEIIAKSMLTKSSDVVLHQDPRGTGSGTNVSISRESLRETPIKEDITSYINLPVKNNGNLPVVIKTPDDLKLYIIAHLLINKSLDINKINEKIQNIDFKKYFKQHR